MHKLLALSVVVFCVVLTGCASPAQVGNMRATVITDQAQMPSVLRNDVYIDYISGGKGTNPLWTSQVSQGDFRQALEQSLQSAGLLTPSQNGRYRLNANLDGLRQPLFGASMTVSSKVHYSLVDTRDNRTVYEKTIDTPYTAAFTDALMGVTRLRLANEGAIRKNIEALIRDLQAMNVSHLAL
ncbi:hypothetical protein ACBQ16_02875 [Halopseudomonas bauzanensis]|uniref:hypothetical protein n=1 Tax=Halopseudomonas bauzanensis TaxID=653930 RepID=UPI003523E46C